MIETESNFEGFQDREGRMDMAGQLKVITTLLCESHEYERKR